MMKSRLALMLATGLALGPALAMGPGVQPRHEPAPPTDWGGYRGGRRKKRVKLRSRSMRLKTNRKEAYKRQRRADRLRRKALS